MEEKWKAIKGYETLYEISNMGNVRSLKRNTTSGKVLKPVLNSDGYYIVSLSKNNKAKTYNIHRLVASAFIQNDDPEKNIINHKNEIKTDNRVDNLEWCTVKYNTNYNNMPYRRANWCRKPIIATKNGESLQFKSLSDVAEYLGVAHGNISSCLKRKYGHKTLKGYTFDYASKN